MKVNCAEHATFCRSRRIKHFPTVEIYIPAPHSSIAFSDNMRFRLLKGPGNYSICPFHSNFTYHGFKAALEELCLIPTKDPYINIKSYLQVAITESYINSEQTVNK